MGRRATPKDSLHFVYEQGPPKRVRVIARTADGQVLRLALSTAAARDSMTTLIGVVDTAEADKIALRGDPTQKPKPPKRNGKRGVTGPRKIRPPSRLKRVESAALNLHSILSDLVGGEGAPVEIVGNEVTAGLVAAALTELQTALGAKAAPRISKPRQGGLSR